MRVRPRAEARPGVPDGPGGHAGPPPLPDATRTAPGPGPRNTTIASGGNFFIELPGPEIDLYGWAGLDLGVFSPYVFVDWSPTDPHLGVGIGNSIDLPLGDTPLSLIGKTEFAIGTAGPAVFFNIGIRYSHDKVNTPWWWDYYY